MKQSYRQPLRALRLYSWAPLCNSCGAITINVIRAVSPPIYRTRTETERRIGAIILFYEYGLRVGGYRSRSLPISPVSVSKMPFIGRPCRSEVGRNSPFVKMLLSGSFLVVNGWYRVDTRVQGQATVVSDGGGPPSQPGNSASGSNA